MIENQANFVRLKNFGAINNPDGYGKALNHCGESMEVFLRVRNGRVAEALFFTDGCWHTIQAGAAVTGLAQGRALRDCMAITGKMLLENIDDFPPDHGHCIRQALSALKKALRDYALKANSKIIPEKSSIGRRI